MRGKAPNVAIDDPSAMNEYPSHGFSSVHPAAATTSPMKLESTAQGNLFLTSPVFSRWSQMPAVAVAGKIAAIGIGEALPPIFIATHVVPARKTPIARETAMSVLTSIPAFDTSAVSTSLYFSRATVKGRHNLHVDRYALPFECRGRISGP